MNDVSDNEIDPSEPILHVLLVRWCENVHNVVFLDRREVKYTRKER